MTRVTSAPSPTTTESDLAVARRRRCARATTVARAKRPTPHEQVAVHGLALGAGEADAHRLVELGVGRHVEHGDAAAVRGGDGGGPVARARARRWPATPRRMPCRASRPSGSSSLHVEARTGGARRGTARPSRSTGVNRHSSSRPGGHGEVGDGVRRRALGARLVGDHRRGAVGVRAAWWGCWSGLSKRLMGSADCSFHLQLDEAVELEGVLHRAAPWRSARRSRARSSPSPPPRSCLGT